MICLAHDSGGPKLDIVTHSITGYLAADLESYLFSLHTILELSESEALVIQKNARDSVRKRFSEERFAKEFVNCVSKVLK